MERLSDERLAEIEAVDESEIDLDTAVDAVVDLLDEVKRAREVYRVEVCIDGDPDAEDESAATWQQPIGWARGTLEWCRGYTAAQKYAPATRYVRESDGKVVWG